MDFGMRLAPTLHATPDTTFLGPDDVPVQKQTVRVGDRVRILQGRMVVRVGYAKVPADYHDEVSSLLAHAPDGLQGLEQLLGGASLSGTKTRTKIVDALAYAMAAHNKFGGSTRGVVMASYDQIVGMECLVLATRHHQLGHRYPGSGGWSYSGDYDYEPGGLEGRKTITVCTMSGLPFCRHAREKDEFLSGDLEVVESAPR